MHCTTLDQKPDYKNSEAFLIFWYNDPGVVIPMVYKIEANSLVNMDVY